MTARPMAVRFTAPCGCAPESIWITEPPAEPQRCAACGHPLRMRRAGWRTVLWFGRELLLPSLGVLAVGAVMLISLIGVTH